MTVFRRSCVVCNRPTPARLCSTMCRAEAAHELQRNLRRLPLLRQTGGVTASRYLIGRNAELNAALIPSVSATAGRPV